MRLLSQPSSASLAVRVPDQRPVHTQGPLPGEGLQEPGLGTGGERGWREGGHQSRAEPTQGALRLRPLPHFPFSKGGRIGLPTPSMESYRDLLCGRGTWAEGLTVGVTARDAAPHRPAEPPAQPSALSRPPRSQSGWPGSGPARSCQELPPTRGLRRGRAWRHLAGICRVGGGLALGFPGPFIDLQAPCMRDLCRPNARPSPSPRPYSQRSLVTRKGAPEVSTPPGSLNFGTQ